jgi:hypothetical protein
MGHCEGVDTSRIHATCRALAGWSYVGDAVQSPPGSARHDLYLRHRHSQRGSSCGGVAVHEESHDGDVSLTIAKGAQRVPEHGGLSRRLAVSHGGSQSREADVLGTGDNPRRRAIVRLHAFPVFERLRHGFFYGMGGR